MRLRESEKFYFPVILNSILRFFCSSLGEIIYPKYKNIWDLITYSLGLSIVLLMLLGLSINNLLPLVNITKPLTLYPLLASVRVLHMLFWLLLFFKNKPLPFVKKLVNTIRSPLDKKKINV